MIQFESPKVFCIYDASELKLHWNSNYCNFVHLMHKQVQVVWLSNIWYLDQFTHSDGIQRYHQICKFFQYSRFLVSSFDVCTNMCFVLNDSHSELDFYQKTIDWLNQWFCSKNSHLQFEILQKWSVSFGPVWRIVTISCNLIPFLATKMDNKFNWVKRAAENSACSE